MKKPYVIAICGGTCSGKSTLADKLENILDKKYKVSTLHMDDYYKWSEMKTIAPITRIEYPEHNHPGAVDIDTLCNDLVALISDKTHDVILLEGLFAFYFEQLREKLDLKIFVDLKSDERIYRRIKRAISQEALDEIAVRYLDTVRYRHDEFVEPTRWHADIVINGTIDANLGADMVVSYVESRIGQ